MKRILKKMGRFFLLLRQENEDNIRPSVLLVDGSFILRNNFALIVRGVRKKFGNAKLAVLTFKEREDFIRDNFPGVEIIIPSQNIRPRKYGLAIRLLLLLRRRFSFIVVSSLDISTLSISAIFGRCPLFLHNRWMEWYRIRRRTFSDVFSGIASTDRNRRRNNRGIKEILKSMGRVFVILSKTDGEEIKQRILIEDNGYTSAGYIISAVRTAEKIFINPRVVILTFSSRKEDFCNNFPHLEVITISERNSKYGLAAKMLKMRKPGFDYVVLTTLDISPLLVSFAFMKTKILLYNRWHQWWSLHFRNLGCYFKEFLSSLVKAPIFIYLFVATAFILIRTNLRLNLSFSKEPEEGGI